MTVRTSGFDAAGTGGSAPVETIGTAASTGPVGMGRGQGRGLATGPS